MNVYMNRDNQLLFTVLQYILASFPIMTIANLLVSLNDQVRENKGQSLLVTLLIGPLIYVLVNELIRHNARISNLRGPSGLPVIGNIWDIHINAAEKYRAWAKKYGPVYQIQLGNIPVVVVNSASAARTIFGSNAQALSSRPEFYTFHKVLLWFQLRLQNADNLGSL